MLTKKSMTHFLRYAEQNEPLQDQKNKNLKIPFELAHVKIWLWVTGLILYIWVFHQFEYDRGTENNACE